MSNIIVKHRHGLVTDCHHLPMVPIGTDCPTIGPDGECCRCIGQALDIISLIVSMIIAEEHDKTIDIISIDAKQYDGRKDISKYN